MSKYYGQISKLISDFKKPINYQLPIGNHVIYLNKYLGNNITLTFDGKITCIKCKKNIKKTFMQGYCYPCFISSPQTSDCILKPELCQAHEGKSRDMEWSKKNCLIDQYVYLSLTSHLKVGVTKHTQIPTRWIDQGAHQALIFAKVPNRYLAGVMEKEINQYISDKTYWRKMLLGEYPDLNLKDEKEKLIPLINQKYHQYITNNQEITIFDYPILQKLKKIKSLNFDKNPIINGKLLGIKGQYLFFENDFVLNIRKFTGYFLNFENE